MLAALLGFEYEALIALNVAVMAMGLVVTASALVCARRGSRPAMYFLLAWSLLIAGGVALPLSSFGLLPRTFLTEYSVQFGSAAEMLLLSFSLAHRINLLKADNERLMRATNEELERRGIDAARIRLPLRAADGLGDDVAVGGDYHFADGGLHGAAPDMHDHRIAVDVGHRLVRQPRRREPRRQQDGELHPAVGLPASASGRASLSSITGTPSRTG